MSTRLKDGIFGAGIVIVLLIGLWMYQLNVGIANNSHDIIILVQSLQRAGIPIGDTKPPVPQQQSAPAQAK